MKKDVRGRKLMTLKVDMERVYNRIGWDFIKMVLKFGFHSKFVEMIFGCIDSPFFSVLVNGSAIEWFKSNIRLR